jgi:hypothetical protein
VAQVTRPAVRYAPLEYRIAVYNTTGWLVDGFAVELPPDLRWVHVCVRKDGPRDWRIDHYETGLSIIGPLVPAAPVLTEAQRRFVKRYTFDRSSRDRLVAGAIRWMRFLDRRGLLRPKIEAAMRGERGPSIQAALGITVER